MRRPGLCAPRRARAGWRQPGPAPRRDADPAVAGPAGARLEARRAAGAQGFALLAALLIAAIALLATASLVALALSSTSISADDVASARAADLARTGVADALERLRWGWARVGCGVAAGVLRARRRRPAAPIR